MDEYDIERAFKVIEDELIASMIRNMKYHRVDELEEKMEWGMWQVEQLKSLERYKSENLGKFKSQFSDINKSIESIISLARKEGGMGQEIKILNAIKKGYKPPNTLKASTKTMGEFFKLNDRKMEALIKATRDDLKKAEHAMLRMADDQYRKVIFNAQMYANTGAGTYEKAVDMATKDYLSRGINCIEYKDGSRHTVADYASMALRTANKRAYLTGEGEKNKEWGISTVIINKRGSACPKCLPFVGKIMIDDVWSGGSVEDGDYPLISWAISKGLYHPNCRDSHDTYFEGVSTPPDKAYTKKEVEDLVEQYKKDQKRQYAERQSERFGRLKKHSLDKGNRNRYQLKESEWKGRVVKNNDGADLTIRYKKYLSKLKKDENPSLHKYKMIMHSNFTELVKDESLSAPFAYIPGKDVIKYNPKAPHLGDYDMDYVFTHELSHRMDELEYHSWENVNFLIAIETCSKKVYDNKEEVQAWFASGGKHENSFALSDIVNALSEGGIDVPIGHTKRYWQEDKRHKPMEVFADISSIDVLNLDEREGILGELFDAYGGMVGNGKNNQKTK